ncbi:MULTISPECIES: ABC transporter permease [unclassified Massilia]|uniref:ABC transporter permease n=1 Tax=unclassified Massilia TaxID=2609279 RepID=UPI001B8376F1|nr:MULTISPECIES: ABC transporter permease [unclassified Massilia]MBQ5941898.1 ABC transporter permease [Massilia sp. AB1]MBQ5963435.1 ABC transporter permease [Massilia sp. ZL223]
MNPVSTMTTHPASPGLWTLAWRRLRADRIAMAALAVVAGFLVLLLLSSAGLVAADWEEEVAVNYAPPSFVGADAATRALAAAQAPRPVPPNAFDPLAAELAELKAQAAASGPPAEKRTTLPFGADKWGHDVIKKTIKGGETSIVVGLVAAFVAVALGTVFGAVSGFYGGLVDDLFNWFYSVFTSIPSILMILTVAAVLQQKGVTTIVLILGLTGWTGPYRLMRAEYMKHKAREYVMAADAIGASGWRRMFGHILPNVSHVALVQMSILVVGFIKAEVILSFLGFGVPVGVVSWGSMLNEAQNELILGKWWQLAAASGAMALLVTAFSLFADALRDALDPKLK